MRRRLSALFSKYYVKGRNFTMKIMSEKTGKEYPTVELCLAAEKEFDDKVAKEKAEKEAKEKALIVKKETALAERKEAASKVEEKRQALITAQKAYREELSKFCDKYGAYHYSVKSGDESWFNLFDNFFDNFWF
jgi:hypothetical protein